jgi:hypothetical protein
MKVCLRISLLAISAFWLSACIENIPIIQEPKHFIVKDPDAEMSIALTWQVNGHVDGHNYINLDLYFSDTSRLTEEAFLVAARYPGEGDWRNQPVLIASVGEKNPQEEIFPSQYEHSLDDLRKYVGIAVNGQGERYAELTGPLSITYTVVLTLGETIQTLTGSMIYNPGWVNKTAIQYIASCDIDGLYNIYAFRSLTDPIWVVRNSDFVNTQQINVAPSGSRTRENDRLVIQLSWSVNQTSPGYGHIDLDLVAGPSLPGSVTARSESSTSYERLQYKTFNVVDFQREVGHLFFENLNPGNSASVTVNYTYTVYFMDNPFERFILQGSFQTPPINAGTTIYKTLQFNKTGDIVTITL